MKFLKLLLVLIAMIFVNESQADLLGRLEIEDVLKARLEQALKIDDETAKITVRIEYDKYEDFGENLPGTNYTQGSYYATNPEVTDIRKINVQYFSEKKEMTPEQSALIYNLIPVSKNKVNITFKNIPVSESKPTPVQPKDLTEIANKSVRMLSLMLGISLAAAFLIFGVALFFNSSKNRAMFKQQFGNLISSFSTAGFNSSPTQVPPPMTTNSVGAGLSEMGKFIFADYPTKTLCALFSDLYWCEKDATAHYLWNNISNQQKATLLTQLDFLYPYSIYFSNLTPQTDDILFHPYYNKPLDLNKTSQDALAGLVKKNFALWSKISPLRQQSLGLSLKEKIKANATHSTTMVSEAFPESKSRVLPRPVAFGEISFEDEIEIFKDKNLIPQDLRGYVPSLVWLALQDKTFIEQQFEKLDAKYLASAWVAAPEILAQLEQCLPEKKLLLLKSYLNSTTPTRSSSAYQFLFKLGFENSSENYESFKKAS